MPNIPYTSEEFVEVLNKNADLSAQYEQGVESMNEAAQILKNTASDIMADLTDKLDGQFDEFINNLSGTVIVPNVVNEATLKPTGSYASSSTYYNITFGVKVAYGINGDIYLIMQGGTTTAYEYLKFVADSVPDGVTVDTTVPASSSYVTAMPGLMQVGIIHGVTGKVNLSLVMDSVDATYDFINVKVSVTPV